MDAATLDARYAGLYPVQAGYLPPSRHAVTAHNRTIKQRAARLRPEPQGGVAAFARTLQADPVMRMLVTRMIEEVPAEHRTVEDVPELIAQLAVITRTAPAWTPVKDEQHFFPMSALFTYMMMTDAGYDAFRHTALNDALRAVLRDWCAYLDGRESRHVLTREPNGWLSPSSFEANRLDEFVIPDPDAPHGGFASFNAYFHREIRTEVRPIAAPDDPRVIVSPNDGTVYRVARGVNAEARFWIKAQPYSVGDILGGTVPTEVFAGGDILQSYLSGADYHRWHAPVDGTVRVCAVVPGLMFSNLASEGNDIKGTGSQGYYTAVNTRGLCLIEADHAAIGMVCVVPVGITEISSIRYSVSVGRHVRKGDELGRFSYGGSSLAVLFSPGAIASFDPTVTSDNHIQANAAIAVAN